MQVKDCMKHNVYSITAETTTAEAARIFASKHVGSLPVVDRKGKLVGLLQLRDLLELVLPDFLKLLDDFDFVHSFGAIETRVPTKEMLESSVAKLMKPPVSIEAESGLLRAFSLLHKHQIHDLPVVDENGVLVGIVSRVDVGTAFVSNWSDTRAGGE
jgi:CBS domain-containing protein